MILYVVVAVVVVVAALALRTNKEVTARPRARARAPAAAPSPMPPARTHARPPAHPNTAIHQPARALHVRPPATTRTSADAASCAGITLPHLGIARPPARSSNARHTRPQRYRDACQSIVRARLNDCRICAGVDAVVPFAARDFMTKRSSMDTRVATDLNETLCDEIVENIMNHMPALRDLALAGGVCRAWNELAKSVLFKRVKAYGGPI